MPAESSRRSARPASLAGLPRAEHLGARTLPVPFVVRASEDLGQVEWASFDVARSWSAGLDRLCQVCGHEVGGQQVLVHLLAGASSLEAVDMEHVHAWRGELYTSGAGCHPRCALAALGLCPALEEYLRAALGRLEPDQVCVGWTWSGPGQGVQPPFSGSGAPQMIRSDPAAEPISLERLRALAGQDQA